MEFFGLTYCGPQNYIKDCLREGYIEPLKKEEVLPLMKWVEETSTLPKKIQRPNVNVIGQIDCYTDQANGFPLGSSVILKKMKHKGIIKPVGPCDMYRCSPTTSIECGWWMHDPILAEADWYKTYQRYPQPVSPNSRILDTVRKNDKYATFF